MHQSANLKLRFEDLQSTINQIAETLAGKIETIKSLEESMHEAQRQKDDVRFNFIFFTHVILCKVVEEG